MKAIQSLRRGVPVVLSGLLGALLLSACAGGVYPLRATDLEPMRTHDILGQRLCRFPPFTLIDRRSDKTMGLNPRGRSFEFPELETWMRILLQNTATRDGGLATIQIEILRARVSEKREASQLQMALRVRRRINNAPAVHSYRATAIGSSRWKHSAQLIHPLRETAQTIVRAVVVGEGTCSDRAPAASR